MNRAKLKTGIAGIHIGAAAAALLWSCFEAAALYPFIVLLSVYGLKLSWAELLVLLWLFHLAGSLIGLWQARGAKGRLAVALLYAACLLAAYLGFGVSLPVKSLLLLLAAGCTALRGMISGRKLLWNHMNHVLPLIGIAGSFILYAAGAKVPELQSFRPFLYAACLIVLFTLLLKGNAGRVRAASQAGEEQGLPLGRILAANRKWTWGLLVIIVLLTAWQGLGPLLAWVWHKAVSLLQRHGGGQTPADPEPPAEQPPAQGLFPPASQSAIPHWLEVVGNVLLVLVLLGVAALICFGLYRLFRRWLPAAARSWVNRILARLKLLRAIRTEQTGYIDEVERLEQTSLIPRRVRGWRRKQGGAARAGNDPRAAYEFLIRQAIKKGFNYQPSRTPAENGEIVQGAGEGAQTATQTFKRKPVYTELSDENVRELIRQYENARYGR